MQDVDQERGRWPRLTGSSTPLNAWTGYKRRRWLHLFSVDVLGLEEEFWVKILFLSCQSASEDDFPVVAAVYCPQRLPLWWL